MGISLNKVMKNVGLSVLAQIISFLTSFMLGFVVPKFISEYQYSYWQLYVLYITYVGVFHFGLLDGIVLRYAQYDEDQLDKSRMRSQFQFMVLLTTAIAVGIGMWSALMLEGSYRTIGLIVAAGIVTKNVLSYSWNIFQITNQISRYAILVILQRVVYAVIVVALLLLGKQSFVGFCLADIAGDVAAFFVALKMNRRMYVGRGLCIRETLGEACRNISSGVLLMIATFAASFIVGGAKMIIMWRWGDLVFGKVAFSFSVTNLFLTFVTSISVVLFPSLKRMDGAELPKLYEKIRSILSMLLFVALFVYFPVAGLLRVWLPKYGESLVYLGILLPTIVFSTKVGLLTNNYLKAYRREKTMLAINLATMIGSFAAFGGIAYLLHDLDLMLNAVILAVMARSVVSEIMATRIMGLQVGRDILVEVLMTALFMAVVRSFDLLPGACVYALCVAVYGWTYRRRLWAALPERIRKRA